MRVTSAAWVALSTPRDSLSVRAFMAVRWAFVQLRRFLPPTITPLVPANVLLRTYNSGSITDIV
jgi:hypothetical protein